MPLLLWFLILVGLGILYGKLMNYCGERIHALYKRIKYHFSSK